MNIINTNYKKIKINNLFLSFKFIIYINLNNQFHLKNKIINNDLYSLSLNEKYIKSIFNIPNFSFLRNNNLLCIFINDKNKFIDIIKLLENKQFFYSYKNCISNFVINLNVLDEYQKYNTNYIYIQFILKKIKIKILFLFLFFLISIIKCIK
jgi:hypothetical protein